MKKPLFSLIYIDNNPMMVYIPGGY